MYREKNFLGIICARSGSRGLEHKNLMDLGGKPLISWTIEAAQNSRLLDRAIVSTDSTQYAEIARTHGAEVPFLRPSELASDESKIYEVVDHALGWIDEQNGSHYDYVVLLQPTSPFRSGAQIDEAIQLFLDHRTGPRETLVSVCRVPAKVGWLMKERDGRYVDFELDGAESAQRQKLPQYFLPNGAIYISPVCTGDWSFYGPATRYYVMSAEDSIDIDTEEDLEQARRRLSSGPRAGSKLATPE